MGGNGSEEVVQRRGTRKSHYIHPPPVLAPTDRRLIRPIGVVQKKGQTIPVTSWKHFSLAPHVTYRSIQGFVKYKFWKYFRVDPLEVDYAEKVLDQAAMKICKDTFSNIRLQINQSLSRHFVSCGHLKDSKNDQRSIEMLGLRTHRIRLGVMDIDEWLNARGPDPSQPEILCTPLATDRLEYGKVMERRHGEGFNWRQAPINAQAVYDNDGGKTHGRYSTFNGMIDSRQVMYQAPGMTFVMPEVRRHQHRHSGEWIGSPCIKSLPNSSASQSGHNTDFVNNLFASEVAATTPMSQVPCELNEREMKLCV
ncbi:hypothetical protein U9M48_034807 [Paspalum notatum var. saurae]|uniref:Uncharacterized protein n=1 Tax=Paspalum notatum var. saurae TaxID=547442 RepID=A0AAQ3X7Q8_PASNO